jgi:hypothetical protein
MSLSKLIDEIQSAGMTAKRSNRNVPMKVHTKWKSGQGVVDFPYRGYVISVHTLMDAKPETSVYRSEKFPADLFTSYGAGIDNILECKEFIDSQPDAEC